MGASRYDQVRSRRPRLGDMASETQIHPGPINTDMLKMRTPEENVRRIQLVPMKRMGTANEVTRLVLFVLLIK